MEAETAPGATTPSATAPRTTPRTAPETTPRETAPPARTTPETTSPEDGPGGAGDEVPASSQALLTGRGGEITPRVVLVPPFIAVRVELRSADGAAYSLRAEGRTLSADRDVASASTTLDGLRPGRRYVLRYAAGRVVIEASAEPGP